MILIVWLHRILVVLYLVLPVVALLAAVVARARGRRGRVRSLAVTAVTGLLIGLALNLVYMQGTGGLLLTRQILLAGYFAIGLLVLLKIFDFALTATLARALGLRSVPALRTPRADPDTSSTPPMDDPILTANDLLAASPPRPPGILHASRGRSVTLHILRISLLFGLGLPYVMATVMTYRPKVAPADDPYEQLGYRFQPVAFDATDGTRLAGWFIPAAARRVTRSRDIPLNGLERNDPGRPGRQRRGNGRNGRERNQSPGDTGRDRDLSDPDLPDFDPDESDPDAPGLIDRLANGALRLSPDEWGRHTVIVCHGLAASKANQLLLAREFPSHGYNVLIFDFRAHGQSAGQLTTFGDHERRDVLGAVRWLLAERPEQSERIVGVGASMGAAALIAAAADDSPEGRAIDAVAVYGTYDHLGRLAHSVSEQFFLTPMDWLVEHLAVPMASAQTGTVLTSFAPAQLVDDLWPRPLLVIHGIDDEIIPFDHGRALFDSANPAKYRLWLSRKSHNDILEDDQAARAVLEFFKVAEEVPVI